MVGGAVRRYFDPLMVPTLCHCLKMVNGVEWYLGDVYPNNVSQLRRSYQETGEYTNRQGQSCSRMTTQIQYRFLVLLSHRNHMNTARVLEIDFRCAPQVQLPDQIVRY